MTQGELRHRLLDVPLPEEREAEERAWELVDRAYAERQSSPRRGRGRRLLVTATTAAALALLLLTPAGASIRDWIDDAIQPGRAPAERSLTSLPAPGRILVQSEQGTWVVGGDGSQRLLGDYAEAAWSPRGRYVVATQANRLVALEPDGDVRWTLTRPVEVASPDWQAPDGFRIAYLSGDSLRAVAGDGTSDRLVSKSVDPVPPAWKPGDRDILAFVDVRGGLRVWRAGSRQLVVAVPRSHPAELAWSPSGSLLAVNWGPGISVLPARGAPAVGVTSTRPTTRIRSIEFAPSGRTLAFIRRSRRGGVTRSKLVVAPVRGAPIRERVLFSGPGRLTDVAWSPNGRWLLVAWKDADQWLFINVRHPNRIRAIANISRQFAPGGADPTPFPTLSGWCCAP